MAGADRGARRRRSQQGAAMVEGTIMVPVFIIVWLGIVYLQELYAARGLARAQARRCAFEHAMSGCEAVPAGCSANVSTQADERTPDIAAHASTGTDAELDPFEDIPALQAAFRMLFGTTTGSSVERKVPFPFDAERAGVARGEVVLLCNSKPQTVFEIAKELLCEEIGC